MFEFVYKMFGTGYATIPRDGMQAIPEQLAAQLSKSTFRFNTRVTNIDNKSIYLEQGEKIQADPLIIATDPGAFMATEAGNKIKWKSCYNLYLETERSVFKEAIIALLPNKELLVNNFHYLSDVFGGKNEILSVTVVKPHTLSEDELVQRVKDELAQHCNIQTRDLVKLFHIKKALPDIRQLKYEPDADDLSISPGVYSCGDHLANGSLNAAMASGRLVAEQIIRSTK
jgi:protoporphyrinogen oxidase